MNRFKLLTAFFLIPSFAVCATQPPDKSIDEMTVKSSPVGKDKTTIVDSQDINPKTNKPRSKAVELEDFPVSIATQAALDLKSNLQPGTLTYTANASPSAANILANKFITNYGATGAITITLPAVSYEISRAIVVESAQIIQVTPPSGESFDLSGTTLTTNQSFAGPATVGSKIVITRQRNAAGSWIWSIDVVRGTWAGI